MNMNAMIATTIHKEDQTSKIFKALASPSRRKILTLLRNGEQCVCHIEAFTGFRQAYISQQLKVLKDAGLIIDEREGWNVYYRAINSEIFQVLDDIAQLTGEPVEPFRKQKITCSCPKCNKELKN
jgi:DNA-binding transcriptional ArsR family regulator